LRMGARKTWYKSNIKSRVRARLKDKGVGPRQVFDIEWTPANPGL